MWHPDPAARQGAAATLREALDNLQGERRTQLLLHIAGSRRGSPLPREMLPFLLHALKTDEYPNSYPAMAIARVEGPDTIPALIDVLQNDPKPPARAGAAVALALVGPAAREAVPALQEALCDKDGEVRRRATSALEVIAPQAAPKRGAP